MSKISRCPKCGGNIVEPAFEGDGVFPVGRMCNGSTDCDGSYAASQRTTRRPHWLDEEADQ